MTRVGTAGLLVVNLIILGISLQDAPKRKSLTPVILAPLGNTPKEKYKIGRFKAIRVAAW